MVEKEAHQSQHHAGKLVIFIHGLGGESSVTWGKLPTFLQQDAEFAQTYQHAFFSYPTMFWRHLLSPWAPKIQDLAAGLRTRIENRFAEFQDIVLVCHSLGGLVARQYLLEEVKAGHSLKVHGLILIAVPNNGADLAHIGNAISWRHAQLRQICRNSDLIEFLNKDWFTFGISQKVPSLYILGTQDRTVDRASAQGYQGNQNFHMVIGKGHIDIVKPTNVDDDLVIMLRRFLRELSLGHKGRTLESAEPTAHHPSVSCCDGLTG